MLTAFFSSNDLFGSNHFVRGNLSVNQFVREPIQFNKIEYRSHVYVENVPRHTFFNIYRKNVCTKKNCFSLLLSSSLEDSSFLTFSFSLMEEIRRSNPYGRIQKNLSSCVKLGLFTIKVASSLESIQALDVTDPGNSFFFCFARP